MTDPVKPWWAPDAQGFLAASIVAICGVVVLMRMHTPSTTDDKVLDMMITILFSTCLVTVYNYSFGSSRGSQAKDESQTKMVEKLTTAPEISAPLMAAAVTAAAEKAAAEAAKPKPEEVKP